MATPNEYIVKDFSPRDRKKTEEEGEKMVAAGAKDIRSANDFLTRVQEPAPITGHQIGFEKEGTSIS